MLKIKSVIEDVFEISLADKDISTLKLNDVEQWDSMGNMNLLLAIEEAYDVRFAVEEMEELNSIVSIVASLSGKGKVFD
jgi:acyl carrier protein